jgi:hypothetical protein
MAMLSGFWTASTGDAIATIKTTVSSLIILPPTRSNEPVLQAMDWASG